MGKKISEAEMMTASVNIIASLGLRSAEMERMKLIRYVYNEAIDDAARFTEELAKRNPSDRIVLNDLQAQLRHYLTLREVKDGSKNVS